MTIPVINPISTNYVYGVQFDAGTEGVAYHDTTGWNDGAPAGVYNGRLESVDTELFVYTGTAPSPTFTHNIAYIRTGEWLQYTINVIKTGKYNLEYCYSTPRSGNAVSISVDGVIKMTYTLPNTGANEVWQTYKAANNSKDPLTLSAGTHVIRITFVGDYQNLLWFNLVYAADIAVVTAPVSEFSANVTSGTLPLAVKFTDKSSNTPTSWAWNFGDIFESTLQNPTHIYETSGTYSVTLTTTNSAGSHSITKSNSIVINDPVFPTVTEPIAMFGWVDAPVGSPVQFYDHSEYVPTEWHWAFGDGTSSTERNPSHIYTAAGTYNVQLSVANAAGLNWYIHAVTISAPITVTSKPVTSFKSNPVSGKYNNPQIITFQNTTTAPLDAPVTSWLWDFGDGNTSTAQNPTHGYIAVGLYTVMLTATNSAGSNVYQVVGCFNIVEPETPTTPIEVTKPIVASHVSLSSVTVPVTASFYDDSLNTPTSWFWNFDDGTTSAEQNPVHIFTVAGTYSIRFRVTNSFGSSEKFFDIIVRNPVDGKPNTQFVSIPSVGGDIPYKVQFFDRSETPSGAPITNWEWSFGDGSSSTEQNPVHTYTTTGLRTVRLVTTNINGYTTFSRVGYLEITDNGEKEPIVAAFRAIPSSGKHPLTVSFVNDSTGIFKTANWDFGDGKVLSQINASHTYTDTIARDYHVTLRVTAVDGRTSSITKLGCVSCAAPDSPTPDSLIDFSADIVTCEINTPIQFTNTSQGILTDILWHFNNSLNETSTTRDPLFSYVIPGLYTVLLHEKIDGVDYNLEKKNYIRVTPTATEVPVANFTIDTNTGTAPLVVTFTDTTVGYPYTWLWDFGDGSTSTNPNPTHTFLEPGNYTVSLTATNKLGSNQIVKTNCVEVSTVSDLNYGYSGVFEYNNGLLSTQVDTSKTSYNLTYRPNSIRCVYGTYQVIISKMTTTGVQDAQVGLVFNSKYVLRVDADVNKNSLPISGYGVYLDYRINAIVVKRFGESDVTELKVEYLTTPLAINHLYTLRVVRDNTGYIKVYLDGVFVCQVYDIQCLDECAGIIVYDTTDGARYVFDDLMFDDMQYAHTPNSSVYMGGVSHGGKFNHINVVENKFIAGTQVPVGKYYGEVCLLANAYTEVIVDYKNFTRNRPISYESYDNLNDITALTTTRIQLGARKTTLNMKIDLDVANDAGCECGITIRENNTNNYKPVTIVEYIALAPIASSANQNMFPQDLAMMCYTKPSTYRKLENKRVW